MKKKKKNTLVLITNTNNKNIAKNDGKYVYLSFCYLGVVIFRNKKRFNDTAKNLNLGEKKLTCNMIGLVMKPIILQIEIGHKMQ